MREMISFVNILYDPIILQHANYYYKKMRDQIVVC